MINFIQDEPLCRAVHVEPRSIQKIQRQTDETVSLNIGGDFYCSVVYNVENILSLLAKANILFVKVPDVVLECDVYVNIDAILGIVTDPCCDTIVTDIVLVNNGIVSTSLSTDEVVLRITEVNRENGLY